MTKKIGLLTSKRGLDVARIVWESIRRNKDYKRYYQVGKNPPVQALPVEPNPMAPNNGFEMYQSQIDWGMSELIDPEKNFGSLLDGSNTRKKDLTRWELCFRNYLMPVYAKLIRKNFAAFTVNLHAPRTLIEEEFGKALTVVIEQSKQFSRSRFRLEMNKDGSVNMAYYRRIFSVFDYVETAKRKNAASGRKRINWKLVPGARKEKEARDAYKKAHELIEGGFRRIT